MESLSSVAYVGEPFPKGIFPTEFRGTRIPVRTSGSSSTYCMDHFLFWSHLTVATRKEGWDPGGGGTGRNG